MGMRKIPIIPPPKMTIQAASSSPTKIPFKAKKQTDPAAKPKLRKINTYDNELFILKSVLYQVR